MTVKELLTVLPEYNSVEINLADIDNETGAYESIGIHNVDVLLNAERIAFLGGKKFVNTAEVRHIFTIGRNKLLVFTYYERDKNSDDFRSCADYIESIMEEEAVAV